MVGNAPPVPMSMPATPTDPTALGARLDAMEGIALLRRRLAGNPVYLVGGAVRDLLRGAPNPDLDLVVEGDAIALTEAIGAKARGHDRFGTASVEIDGLRVDLASARREHYERPGALPVVEAAGIALDLSRRDFTVNAMALPLFGIAELIDPHGGLRDLRAGLLRVLHPGSFSDDPTRALRAARYAARLGFELEPETARLVERADLGTVSRERIDAELWRLVAEPAAPGALDLLARWELAGIDPAASARLGRAEELLDRDDAWRELAGSEQALVAVACPDAALTSAAERLARADPGAPSEAAALARGRPPAELLLARTLGAAWLDGWVGAGRHVRLEIDGQDLIAAGVPEGPAVGRGLDAALAAKLDGTAPTRDDELRLALAAAS